MGPQDVNTIRTPLEATMVQFHSIEKYYQPERKKIDLIKCILVSYQRVGFPSKCNLY